MKTLRLTSTNPSAKRANSTLRKTNLRVNGLHSKLGLGMGCHRRTIKAGRSYALKKLILANKPTFKTSTKTIIWW